jgi:tripartite-type tricarboxylate transporter receptor subunit TctC
LAAELFMLATGTQMVHVPYRGSGQVIADLTSGVVDVNFDTLSSVLPFIRQGGLRALAVTTRDGAAQLPGVPTVMASGLTDYDISVWYMLQGPAGLPDAVAQRWSAALGRALADPVVRGRIQDSGFEPAGGTPAEAAALVRADIARYGAVIRRAGITLE